MAVREFDGTDDNIVWALGALTAMTYGTVAALVQRRVLGELHTLLALADSGAATELQVFVNDNNDLIGVYNGANSDEASVALDTAGIWFLVVVRKDTGNQSVRVSARDSGDGTWSHGATALLADWSAPGSGGSVDLTFGGSAEFLDGRYAVLAAWSNTLPWTADAAGDAAIEAAGLETALSNWVDASPDALWSFDQTSTSTPVDDLTGNGADQVTLVGTTVVVGDDPPGFDFSLAGIVNGTASLTLGGLDITATGKRVVHGSASVALGGITVTGVGVVEGTVAGTATLDLGGITITATDKRVVHGTASLTLGGITIHGTGPQAASINLTLTALTPVLRHGSATTPELADHTALTPELAHGDVGHTLGHGQPGPPTTGG